jgi:hypothetical protein
VRKNGVEALRRSNSVACGRFVPRLTIRLSMRPDRGPTRRGDDDRLWRDRRAGATYELLLRIEQKPEAIPVFGHMAADLGVGCREVGCTAKNAMPRDR